MNYYTEQMFVFQGETKKEIEIKIEKICNKIKKT